MSEMTTNITAVNVIKSKDEELCNSLNVTHEDIIIGAKKLFNETEPEEKSELDVKKAFKKMSKVTFESKDTHYDKVVEFMDLFGQPTHQMPQPELLKENNKLRELRLSLIDEEVKELHEACENDDFIEVIDACGDIMYVVLGMCATYGININAAFDIIHKSNMTKFCISEEEAQKTVAWYKHNETRYDSPTYKLCDDGIHWMVFNESTKKVLKSINYVPANFKSLMAKTN